MKYNKTKVIKKAWQIKIEKEENLFKIESSWVFGNARVLDYIKKINNVAKYCEKIKKEAYKNKEYKKCNLYKNEQNKLYLLKALCILHLKEYNILKRTQLQKDENDTILELYSSDDKQYNFHLISIQKENENYIEYTNNRKIKPISKYYSNIRYLRKILPEEYKKIYNVITNLNFNFDSEDTLILLKDAGVHGIIQKQRDDYDCYMRYYYCNLYMDDILICKITVVIDRDNEGEYLSDESGYLEVKDYHLEELEEVDGYYL